MLVDKINSVYWGSNNLMTFGNDVNIMKRGDNVQYIYSMSPTFIEFDKNNKIVSILTHLQNARKIVLFQKQKFHFSQKPPKNQIFFHIIHYYKNNSV